MREIKTENTFPGKLVGYALIFLYVAGVCFLGCFLTSSSVSNPGEATEKIQEKTKEKKTSRKEKNKDSETAKKEKMTELSEADIYSFLQGSGGWDIRYDWSGSWCYEILGGQAFGFFGCGLCDLANIYSTLTDYECSPVDMYYYAAEVTGYSPGGGFGAIDWPYMLETLAMTGIDSRLYKKEEAYEDFQKRIAGGITAIVLVCSADDDTYWKGVDGHYVNIWLYDEKDDTVFLCDSGNREHNRQRIPLRYVYDALCSYSAYQYLLVTDVEADENQWKHDGIDEDWVRP